MKPFFILLLLLVFILSCSTVPVNESDKGEPLPYGENEFSPGLMKVRRAEILLLGSLPLFYMLTSAAYDIIVTVPPDRDTQFSEKITISLSLSGLLTLADFIVGENQQGRNNKSD